MSNEFHDENNLYHFSYRDPNAGSHAESAAGSIVEPAADPVVTNTPAQPKKHHRGAGRVVALLLSCAVISAACGFGGAILAAGEKGQLCRDIVASFYSVIERLMAFIISLSPIGVFTYMSWVVATQGVEILGSLALVILCAYIGYVVHAVVVYSSAVRIFAGISPLRFFKGASAAMMFAFSTTSSAATIPVSKECADEMGADQDVAAFVLPLGATVNMDGTAIYQCVATIFLATCAGMHLGLGQMVTIVITATLASIGTAGTPGAGMVMLTMVLTALNIPVDYIGLIVAVDRLFDMGRTCMNVTGDISCTLCVSKWEGKLVKKN